MIALQKAIAQAKFLESKAGLLANPPYEMNLTKKIFFDKKEDNKSHVGISLAEARKIVEKKMWVNPKKRTKPIPRKIKKAILKSELLIENTMEMEQAGSEMSLVAEQAKEDARNELLNKKKGKKSSNPFAIKPLNKWFSFSAGYKTTLLNFNKPSSNREYAKVSVNISPIKYFFLGATFNKDTNSYHSPYYQPDFSYSFGYSDWHSATWSLIYSNYSNNKINPKEGENRFNFSAGSWDLGYKDKIKGISVSGSLKYTVNTKKGVASVNVSKVFDNGLLLSGKLKSYLHMNQQQLSLTSKHFLYKRFYVMGSIYLYAHYDKQSSLEPDYAYKFGWQAKKKGDLSFTYSNYYSPTRWNWREAEGSAFNTGSLSVSMSF